MKSVIIFFVVGITSLLIIASIVAASGGEMALDVEKRPTAETIRVYPEIIIIERVKAENRPIYEVNGDVLDEDLQHKLYDALDRRGISFWYPYALCELYQESRFDVTADNGEDYGLCQFRRRYWTEHATLAGIPDADIYSVDDQIEVYAGVISVYLKDKQIADVYRAYFNSGNPDMDDQYVRDVTQWYSKLRRLK